MDDVSESQINLRANDSTQTNTEQTLELNLNMKDLEAIQRSFAMETNNYNAKISLDREQFIYALSEILGKGTYDQLSDLFDKIDLTKEGFVDWDKFASHMLLNFYEKDDRVKSTSIPQWKDLKSLNSVHKDIIQRICYLKNLNRYLSISKEGCVCLWGMDAKLQKTIKTGTDSCKQRDIWVTDFVVLPGINKVSISYTSKEIGFYDLSAKLDFTCQFKLQGLERTPLCLDYWVNQDNSNDALMVWGDANGYINVLSWSSASISLFERSAPAADKEENLVTILLTDIINGKTRNCRYMSNKSHQDWIRKVQYIPNLECFISCATNWSTSMTICWLEKQNVTSPFSLSEVIEVRGISKASVFTVHQGISSFCYHESLNLIATAGVNYNVCLWNPYVMSKPNGILRGHMAPVVAVQFNKQKGHLISYSKDKILRIWDVQLQVCIQRLAGVFPKGQEVITPNPRSIIITHLFYHEERMRLFMTFNYGLAMLEIKPMIKDKVMSHDYPIVGILYNSIYNQIITGDQSGLLHFWMNDTGQRVKSLQALNIAESELTCLAQDHAHTRLYTGGTDGLVKVWDINGHCHHTLICSQGNPIDIGQIIVLKRCVVVLGFSKSIVIFWTAKFTEHEVHPSEWKATMEHRDDILTGCGVPPHGLATGSYDGQILVWNLNSEQVSRQLNERSRSSTFTEKKSDTILSKSSSSLQRQRKLSEAAFKTTDNMFNVTRIFFLETRKAASDSDASVANLISCGSNGIVRFWNSNAAKLVDEFVAHENVTSIIMSVDSTEQFIVTGALDGTIKVWDISRFGGQNGEERGGDGLVEQEEAEEEQGDNVVSNQLKLLANWQAHLDEVSALAVFYRPEDQQMMIASCSPDLAATLWDARGNKVGTFGQEERWKITQSKSGSDGDAADTGGEATGHKEHGDEPDVDRDGAEQTKETAPTGELTAKQLNVDFKRASKSVSASSRDSLWSPNIAAVQNPKSYRRNIWEQSLLGKNYQETRVQKRQRQQPSTIPNLPPLTSLRAVSPSDRTKPESAPTNSFYSLSISSFLTPPELEKPDFMDHPERYFRSHEDYQYKHQRAPILAESLKAAFDERSLFPKHILEFMSQLKKYNQLSFEKKQQTKPPNPLQSGSSSNMSSHSGANKNKQTRIGGVKLMPIMENAGPSSRKASIATNPQSSSDQ